MDHPEFPKADPALQYIVSQVSRIDDTASCTAGYYKALHEVLRRLDKTDEELNRIRGLLDGADPQSLAQHIRDSFREIRADIGTELTSDLAPAVNKAVGAVANLNSTSFRAERRMEKLIADLSGIDQKVAEVSKRITDAQDASIERAESDLLDTCSAVLKKYDQLAVSQMDLQTRFETYVSEASTQGYVPSWMAVVLVFCALLGGYVLGGAVC